MRQALIALEDGTVFAGEALEPGGEVLGEMVFNTSMAGYQEILTDPSYAGQIVTMTYPLIGNYGVSPEDEESARPQVRGFVVKELSRVASNWRATGSLTDYLQQHQVLTIQGVDTRELTRRVRLHGVMDAAMSTEDLDPDSLLRKARTWAGLEGLDMVAQVTCSAPYECAGENPRFHVVAYDFGIKRSITRQLLRVGCRVTVVPARTPAEQVLALAPDGVFLSNGPGDPRPLDYAITATRTLLGKVPIFGICLGHQLLGLACGAKTFKLKFGHRGANQPVMDLETGKVEITSQNHGFAVDEATLPPDLVVTHRNLNDGTIEGVRHKSAKAASVQYHPEAAAGPHDSAYLFNRFRTMMA